MARSRRRFASRHDARLVDFMNILHDPPGYMAWRKASTKLRFPYERFMQRGAWRLFRQQDIAAEKLRDGEVWKV